LDIIDELEKASDIVSGISTGRIKWRMSVPADVENDPDLVLTFALVHARTEIKRLRSVIKEADDYLDTNSMTNIAHGSILHRKFKDA